MKKIDKMTGDKSYSDISHNEYFELKSILLEHSIMLSMIMPSKATVSFISDTTGISRQTITSFIKNNFEPEVDFWVEKGKIYLSKTTTMQLLRKYNAK